MGTYEQYFLIWVFKLKLVYRILFNFEIASLGVSRLDGFKFIIDIASSSNFLFGEFAIEGNYPLFMWIISNAFGLLHILKRIAPTE